MVMMPVGQELAIEWICMFSDAGKADALGSDLHLSEMVNAVMLSLHFRKKGQNKQREKNAYVSNAGG